MHTNAFGGIQNEISEKNFSKQFYIHNATKHLYKCHKFDKGDFIIIGQNKSKFNP